MKRILALTILFSFLALPSQRAHAATNETDRPFGLGFVLGAPTAITGKYWLNSQDAVDMGLSFNSSDYFLVYADYLYHARDLFGHRDPFVAQLTPYIGVGVIIADALHDRYDNDHYLGKTSGSIGAGVRVPVGIEWTPNTPPIGIFAEIAPGISVIPATDGIVEAGLGIRYYF